MQSRCRPGVSFREPEWSYGRDYGTTVTGGFVYRGTRYASLLGGTYLAGDFGSGRVFTGHQHRHHHRRAAATA